MDADKGARPWQGKLEIGDGWALWAGSAGDSRLHRHLAAQAVWADRPVGVLSEQGLTAEATLFLIDPLVSHRLLPASNVRVLFLDPSQTGPLSLAALDKMEGANAGAIHLPSDKPRLQFWGRAWTAPDSRQAVAAALAVIDLRIADGALKLMDVAPSAGLSVERLRHVFADAIGMPFKRYVLWRRLQRAVTQLASGDDVTTAAHAAGFADAAHLARTMRSMFGISASQLVGHA